MALRTSDGMMDGARLPGLHEDRPKKSRRGPRVDPDVLTPRELEALELSVLGLGSERIAQEMGGISPWTVRSTLERAKLKLDAHTRMEAAFKAGIIQLKERTDGDKSDAWLRMVPLGTLVPDMRRMAPARPQEAPARALTRTPDVALDATIASALRLAIAQLEADNRVREWARAELLDAVGT